VNLHLTQHLANSFIEDMDHYCLRFRYRLQSNTTIVSLIERVSTDMANSDRKWQFGHHSHALRQLLSRNETQPLQLLALGNRGIARIRERLITLSRQPPNSQLTLKGLFTPTNVSKYCRPQLTIRGKLLILNFGMISYSLSSFSGLTCFHSRGPVGHYRTSQACT